MNRVRSELKPVKAISARDVVVLCFLPVQFLISWCLPERLWHRSALILEVVTTFLYVKGGRRTQDLILSVMGGHLGNGFSRQVTRQLASEEFISILQILRDYRPGRWRPEVKLVGLENLKAALERGQGAILWVSYTHGAKLLAKMAIYQAGYSVFHLSRPRHGLSPTKFGIRWLNKVQTTIENRYIAERIVVKDGEFQKAVRSLMTRLRANKVISITVHRDALRPTAVRFLEGEIVLADGACKLAYRTQAALLPVFAFRDTDGVPNVQIGTPIELRVGQNEDDSVSFAHREYVARLETFVLAYPGQWRGWYQLL
jgi:lauroyl/myristoyl acyltransferase